MSKPRCFDCDEDLNNCTCKDKPTPKDLGEEYPRGRTYNKGYDY